LNILFVDNFSINFGVAHLSTLLKNGGHQVALLNYPFSKWHGIDIYRSPERHFAFDKIAREVLLQEPDLICFSVCSPNFMFFKNLVAAVQKISQVPTLVGGVLPSLMPEMFMEQTSCDFLYRGEAENQILDLVERIRMGTWQEVPNLCYRQGAEVVYKEVSSFVSDLDSLPIYDNDLYGGSESQALFVLTSRGCVMKCTFCSAGQYSGMVAGEGNRAVRKRSVDSVLSEIKERLQAHPYKEIFFYDDFFVTNSRWLREFAERYRQEINLPYYCAVFPSSVTGKIADLLAWSGCKSVQMGFQSANDIYKLEVLKRKDTKERIVKAARILDERGVAYFLDHILNLPGETHEDIEQALDFYLSNDIRSLSIFFLNYFPDAPISRWAYENGFMSREQYELVMVNGLVGEQSFKGTVLDEKLADESVRYAMVFRLIALLPGRLVRWIFNKRYYRFFPTNKILYYLLSGVAELRTKGFRYLFIVLFLSFAKPSSKMAKKTEKPSLPGPE
jgi:anaerobic magnesium-protoporphyrin IX monomethyl ester cyclase